MFGAVTGHPYRDSLPKSSKPTGKEVRNIRSERDFLLGKRSRKAVRVFRELYHNLTHVLTFLHETEGLVDILGFEQRDRLDRLDAAFQIAFNDSVEIPMVSQC